MAWPRWNAPQYYPAPSRRSRLGVVPTHVSHTAGPLTMSAASAVAIAASARDARTNVALTHASSVLVAAMKKATTVPAQTLATDAFTRANAGTLGTTETGGYTWVDIEGDFQIVSNQAVANGDSVSAINLGVTDHSIEADLPGLWAQVGVRTSPDRKQGIVAAWSDTSSTLGLYKQDLPGTNTLIASTTLGARGRTLLRVRGDDVRVYVDGVEVLSWTIDNDIWRYGTRVSIVAAGGGAIDNVTAYGAAVRMPAAQALTIPASTRGVVVQGADFQVNGGAEDAGTFTFPYFFASWNGGADPGAVVTRTADGTAPEGSYVAVLSQTNPTTAGNPRFETGHRDSAPAITPGRYAVSYRMKADRANQVVQVGFIGWVGATETIRAAMIGETLQPSDGWVTREFHIDVPATTDHYGLYFHGDGQNSTGDVFRVDAITTRPAGLATTNASAVTVTAASRGVLAGLLNLTDASVLTIAASARDARTSAAITNASAVVIAAALRDARSGPLALTNVSHATIAAALANHFTGPLALSHIARIIVNLGAQEHFAGPLSLAAASALVVAAVQRATFAGPLSVTASGLVVVGNPTHGAFTVVHLDGVGTFLVAGATASSVVLDYAAWPPELRWILSLDERWGAAPVEKRWEVKR